LITHDSPARVVDRLFSPEVLRKEGYAGSIAFGGSACDGRPPEPLLFPEIDVVYQGRVDRVSIALTRLRRYPPPSTGKSSPEPANSRTPEGCRQSAAGIPAPSCSSQSPIAEARTAVGPERFILPDYDDIFAARFDSPRASRMCGFPSRAVSGVGGARRCNVPSADWRRT
jgi:hypothetical protein